MIRKSKPKVKNIELLKKFLDKNLIKKNEYTNRK